MIDPNELAPLVANLTLEMVYYQWARNPQQLIRCALTVLLNVADSASLACYQLITYATPDFIQHELKTTIAHLHKRQDRLVRLANALQKELDQL